MEERRRFVRLDTRLEISYTVLPEEKVRRGATKNVSGSGICLFSDKELSPGTRLQVAMKLPDREQPVHFVAEVIWSESYEVIGKTERQRAVENGVRFVEISPQDQDAIMRHVILTLQPRIPTP